MHVMQPSVLRHCWLGGRKGIRPVKTSVVGYWHGYLSGARCKHLYMAQLVPLPLTVSCFSKIQIGFIFLVPAHLGSLGKKAVKRVCVCMWCSLTIETITMKQFSSINGLQLTKTASSKWQKLHQSKQVNTEPAGSERDNWEQGGWSAAASQRYAGMPRRRHTMRHSLRRTRTEWEARRVHDTRVSAARLECVGRYSRTERATDHRKPWEHSPRPHHQEPYQSVPQSHSHCRRHFIKVGKGLNCGISKQVSIPRLYPSQIKLVDDFATPEECKAEMT